MSYNQTENQTDRCGQLGKPVERFTDKKRDRKIDKEEG